MANELLRTINHTDYLGLWVMDVYQDGTVQVKRCGEVREYNLPKIVEVKRGVECLDKELIDESMRAYMESYVVITAVDGLTYQFKFEEENFLVGDIIDLDDEHVGEFAMHVFGEEDED
jgi:hypothetical protein